MPGFLELLEVLVIKDVIYKILRRNEPQVSGETKRERKKQTNKKINKQERDTCYHTSTKLSPEDNHPPQIHISIPKWWKQ